MRDLHGKVAIVTGGASGIGLATARALVAAGARVVLADRQADAGRAAAEELGATFVTADVAEPDDWVRIVATATETCGGVDLAHLNAGVLTGEGAIDKLSDEQYHRIMRANVDGVVFGSRAVVPAMSARGGGAIVVTASLAGLIPFPPDPIYALTKHAVVGLVRSLGTSLAAQAITVNAVCPGITDTPLAGDAKAVLERVGFPIIEPEAIAAAVIACLQADGTGECFVCQAGIEPTAYRFSGVPGPSTHTRPPPGMGEV